MSSWAEVPRTRLAPSPTGALHLGNARTFLVNWALARRNGWRVVLRMDDLDGPRVKKDASQAAIDILQWLGIDWDEGPYYQTPRQAEYDAALARLAQAGCIYPCDCTRTQIQAASLSAPQAGDHELRYPGTCRWRAAERRGANSKRIDVATPDRAAWRLIVPDRVVQFEDRVLGLQQHNVQAEVGDFLVRTKAGWPSYQLAVVVDDVAQGITHVVRGADLMASTCRQQLIYQALGFETRLPQYFHLPIVVGTDGRRLAKRHGDTRVASFREAGMRPEQIIGLMASWSGVTDGGSGNENEMSAADFISAFDIDRLPRETVVFTGMNRA